MIHEVFTPIEDPQMAKTCSEVFRGEYRFVQTDQDAEQYGQAQAFLTHPDIELLTVQLNYLEESPSGELWSPIKFANLQYKLPSKQRIIDNYAHFGGFGGGYVMARLLDPLKAERVDHLAIAVGLLAASVLSVIASVIHGLYF